MSGIQITYIGMTNPLGIGAEPSAVAVRAGINRYVNSDALSETGEPIKIAHVPDECLPEVDELDCSQQGDLYKRLLQLALSALNETNSKAQLKGSVPLLLALPEQRCGRPFPAMEPILKDLNRLTDLNIDMLTSRIFTEGRAAGMLALQEAQKILMTTDAPAIIVGGVDSYLDNELLVLLDQEKRMMGDNSFDGFVPGEGAAFIVLQKTGQDSGPQASFILHAAVTAEEPGHLYSQVNCLGEGLTTSVAQVLSLFASAPTANSNNKLIQTVLSSLNGESLHVKEWSFALTRNVASFAQELVFEHPAEYYGDLGAATIPTLLCLAHIGLNKRTLTPPVLVWGASDEALRGACVIA